MTTKICFNCKTEKPLAEFYRSNIHYYQKECKDCCRLRKAAWYKTEAGKRSSANTKLKRRFGVTIEQYELDLKNQEGKRAICKESLNTLGHRLGYDHNHLTGQ